MAPRSLTSRMFKASSVRLQVPERLRTALGLTPSGSHYFFFRHGWIVRVSHWVNALCLAILLMSGLNIFNAHSALYWGESSNFIHPLMAVGAQYDDDGRITAG